MLVDLAPGCAVEVDRGPNWLFVRLPRDGANANPDIDLAGQVWSLLEQAFTHRLVVEMDEVATLPSFLIGQLVKLQERISKEGGIMRISGLSDHNHQVLHECHLENKFPHFRTRAEAVLGEQRPTQPK